LFFKFKTKNMKEIIIKKKEEFIYEFSEIVEKELAGEGTKVKVEELIAVVDERELGNQLLSLTNQIKELININNAIINFKINSLNKQSLPGDNG